MAIIDIQKKLGVVADGLYGDNSHAAYLCQPKRFSLNWDYLRQKLKASFNQSQVNGMNNLLAACNRAVLKPQYIAYIFATDWHETGGKMQPVPEVGRGAKLRYGRWMTNSKGEKYCYRNGDRKNPTYYTYAEYPHLYYGRGEPQLTWLDNYIKAGKELGIDFANNPDLVLLPENSANILVKGSMGGWFTGRGIPDYVTYGHYDEFVEARRVINGVDRKHDIAKYAKIFLTALEID